MQDNKIDDIIAFAEQNPEKWYNSYGDEGYSSMEKEVREYFNHYRHVDNLGDHVRMDLGIS